MTAVPSGTPDLQFMTRRVRLLEHTVRDNVSSVAESESVLHNRIRELEVSEKSLLQKVEELTANSILRLPSMQQPQRLDERLRTLREEVRSVSQEKERGERVWRDRLQRCQAQLRAKEEEMGRQSQYFERFKSQLQQKLDLAREREQAQQTRVRRLENQVLELTGSEAANMTRVNAACLNTVTAADVCNVMLATSPQHRTETDSERLPHPREEGEGEEEDREEKTLLRPYPQQLQQKQGEDDGEMEGDREGVAESPGAGVKLRDFILSLQEDLRVLLEREERWMVERRGLMEQLEEAQENVRFLSCEAEEMRTLVFRLKLAESSLTEEVEELQEENQRLCQRLSYAFREINHNPGSAEPDSKLSPSSADPGPSLDNPSPALDQGIPCSVANFGQVKLTTGLSLRDTPISAHQHGADQRSQEDSTLPPPDLLNRSGHRSENPGILAPGTKSSEPGEMSPGDRCPGLGSFSSLNMDEGTSEETEALRTAYLDMGGDVDHRDLLEGPLRHTQDELLRVSEENVRLKRDLRELGETEACEIGHGTMLTDKKNITGYVQENRVTTVNLIPPGSREPNTTPTQDHTILAFTQDDLSLHTLTQDELVLALNQENRALGRRIQELLSHIESQEGEREQELAQLRQQVSLLEKESSSLEQEKLEQGGLITELTRKTEDDLNTIMELKQRLTESVIQRDLIQDARGSIPSEGGHQSEQALTSEYAKQCQATSGFVNSVQGDLTAGLLNSDELQVGPEDRLTSESVGRLQEERDELTGFVRSQTEEKHQLTRSLWLLKEERDQISQVLCSLKEEKEQLTRSLCGVKDETDKMKRSLCGLTEERDQLVLSMSVLQEEADKLSQSLCTQNDGRDQLKKERDQLMKSICSLKEESEQREQILHNLEQERDKLSSLCLQKDVTALEVDRDVLREQRDQLTEQRDQLTKQKDQLTEERDQLTEQRDQLTEERDRLTEQRNQLTEERDQLTEQRNQLTEQRDQLQMDIATLRNQLLLTGWSHNPQLSGNHSGMATPIEGVASERRGPVSNMDGDGSRKTIDLGPSAQAQLGDKEIDVETNHLVKEMELLGIELRMSTEELEKTKSEAQAWSRELGVSEVRREEAEKKALQAASELKWLREETEAMERENGTLRAEVGEMKSRQAGLKREETDAHSLRIKMEEKFNFLQAELGAKSVALTELSSEYMSLKREHGRREDCSTTIHSLRERYHDVRTKYDALLRQRSQTDLDMAPLKAKLSVLVRKCRQRNGVLVQMLRALRRYGHLDYSLTQEAEDLLDDPALRDYVRAFAPAAALQENTGLLEPAATRLVECSEISAAACTSQPPLSAGESVQITGARSRRGMDRAKINGESSLVPGCLDERERPLLTPSSPDGCASPSRKLTSPEKIINLHQQLQNMLSDSYQVLPFKSSPQVNLSPPPGQGNPPGYPNPSRADATRHEHTPIATNPTTTPLSITESARSISVGATSNHPAHTTSTATNPTTTPLSITESSRSTSVGATSSHPAHTTSTTTAAVLSRTEQHFSATSKTTSPVRTPPTTKAWFVKAPTSPASLDTNPTNPGPPASPLKTLAPTKMVAMTTALPNFLLPVGEHCVKMPLSRFQPKQAISTTLNHTGTKPEHPAEVSSVEVIRMVGQSSLMIGWERPPLDELGCSNGTFVYGYRIYVNGDFHKSVMSSACTKCILENLDLSHQIHISVQTLGSNGLYAEKVHLIFKGYQANFSMDQNPFILDCIHVNTAAARWTDSSSSIRWTPPTHQQKGFTQSVNGRQGLAPLAFLEEVPVPYQQVCSAPSSSSLVRGADVRPL